MARICGKNSPGCGTAGLGWRAVASLCLAWSSAGLVMAAAHASGAEVVQYTPSQVKQAVAGDGRADKDQVGRMVATLLGMESVPGPADAADAAALALCHLAFAPLHRAAARTTVEV